MRIGVVGSWHMTVGFLMAGVKDVRECKNSEQAESSLLELAEMEDIGMIFVEKMYEESGALEVAIREVREKADPYPVVVWVPSVENIVSGSGYFVDA